MLNTMLGLRLNLFWQRLTRGESAGAAGKSLEFSGVE